MILANAPLPQRLGLGIALILLVASALTGTLNVLKFQKVMEDRESTIYEFVVGNIRGVVEDSASLGLPLSVLHNIQVLLDRRRAEDKAILRILVFDDNRRILFDTDRQHIGEALPDPLAPPSPNAQGWMSRSSDSVGIGARLVNAFGTTIGGVLLQHDRDLVRERVTSVAFDVTVATLIATALACLACIPAVWVLTRNVSRRLHLFAVKLEAVADEPGGTGRAAHDAADLVASVDRTLARLPRAEQLIDRLAETPAKQREAVP